MSVIVSSPANNDVLVANFLVASTTINTIPAGWTCFQPTGGFAMCDLLWTTGTATSWTFGNLASQPFCWILTRYQGVDPSHVRVATIPAVHDSFPVTMTWGAPSPEGGLPVMWAFNGGSSTAAGSITVPSGWTATANGACAAYQNGSNQTALFEGVDNSEVTGPGSVSVNASQHTSFWTMGIILGDATLPTPPPLDASFMGSWSLSYLDEPPAVSERLRRQFQQLIERGY